MIWVKMILGTVAKAFGGGFLTKALDSVDKHINAQTDREKIKADIIKTHLTTRASFMKAGGFVLMLLFAAPLAFWFASVCIYSVFFCVACAYPKTWSIAALPAPLDEWAGLIIASIFGVIAVTSFAK